MSREKEYMKVFSKIGYGAKGFVYIVMGFLAIQTVIGISGNPKGAKSALQEIGAQPLGNILLIILAAGLTCYVVWRILHSILDPDNEGNDFYGIVQRAGFFISAVMHGFLVYLTIKLIIGVAGGEAGEFSKEAASTIMSFPFGRIIVGLVGLGIIGSGFYEIYFGLWEKYKEIFKLDEMTKKEKIIVGFLAKSGLSLRGIVFAVIGVLFISSAINYDPDKAGGLAKALDEISKQPFGEVLLGFIALGFIAYGIYIMTLIKYRAL